MLIHLIHLTIEHNSLPPLAVLFCLAVVSNGAQDPGGGVFVWFYKNNGRGHWGFSQVRTSRGNIEGCSTRNGSGSQLASWEANSQAIVSLWATTMVWKEPRLILRKG